MNSKEDMKKAYEEIRAYCQKNGFNLDKFEETRAYDLIDCIAVSMPSKVKPNGLANDMSTLPTPLFVYYPDGRIEELPKAKEILE